MNYINFCLICFQIWCIYKYLKKLKGTEDMLKDNIQDYYELKQILTKHECFINDLNNEIEKLKDLHNKK